MDNNNSNNNDINNNNTCRDWQTKKKNPENIQVWTLNNIKIKPLRQKQNASNPGFNSISMISMLQISHNNTDSAPPEILAEMTA